MNENVKQIRMDALSAEYIYTVQLSRIGLLTKSISVLTIIIPILYTSVLLAFKGSEYEPVFNFVSIFLSAILLSLSVFNLILEIDRKKESYFIGRRNNIYVSSEAQNNINAEDTDLKWFYKFVAEMDSRDRENLGHVSSSLKQEAYRHSLMKLYPGQSDTVCSVCNASPFDYKKGDCQVCGNTPRSNNVSS
ncbi:hypothetical protein RQV60_000549 [Vibrio cholerae]|nr:hypothetical protein [Vibrio cholerae]ELI1749457.1 hypothetical protein [Vibrio cholerae]